MSVQPVGTFCYRLLVTPELGPTMGNTVFVGLNVVDQAERSQLIFSGLPKRIEMIRDALEGARAFDGHLFSTSGTTDARHLQSAMVGNRMRGFQPVLVAGEEILAMIAAERASEPNS